MLGVKRGWTAEELDLVKWLYQQHGQRLHIIAAYFGVDKTSIAKLAKRKGWRRPASYVHQRGRKMPPGHGGKSPIAHRLGELQVDYEAGCKTLADLSAVYGVAVCTICNIARRKGWRPRRRRQVKSEARLRV